MVSEWSCTQKPKQIIEGVVFSSPTCSNKMIKPTRSGRTGSPSSLRAGERTTAIVLTFSCPIYSFPLLPYFLAPVASSFSTRADHSCLSTYLSVCLPIISPNPPNVCFSPGQARTKRRSAPSFASWMLHCACLTAAAGQKIQIQPRTRLPLPQSHRWRHQNSTPTTTLPQTS